MAQNFLGCDREQVFLLPPSVDDWLPEDHFARFVIAAVEEMDLSAFYADYRADGHGRAAHDPAMMVALLVYAYARGQRSSRVIERGCVEDIAFRVIAANRRPDHTTIARFRQRHETALAGLFGEVLALCARAGLAGTAVLAVDGTKLHANASERATRDYEQLAREVLEEAAEIDAAEEERFGGRRGDELPPELASAQGRKKWLAEAKRRLDAQREREARPIPAARAARVREAKRRLEEELRTECAANSALLARRADGPAHGPRHRRPGPTGRRRTPRRAARLEQRTLWLHAPPAGRRDRRRALPPTPGDDRAGVCRHQVQPPHRPLPAPRPLRRPFRVATDHRQRQPAQAPPPPTPTRQPLTRAARGAALALAPPPGAPELAPRDDSADRGPASSPRLV